MEFLFSPPVVRKAWRSLVGRAMGGLYLYRYRYRGREKDSDWYIQHT
jgi:hypothetical protein